MVVFLLHVINFTINNNKCLALSLFNVVHPAWVEGHPH